MAERLTSHDQRGLKALKAVREQLADKLHPSKIDVICDGLASNRILGLTSEESKTIKTRYSQYAKATELIDSLTRTGHTDSDVVQFCQILYNEDQPKCGHILLEALREAGVDVSSIVIPPRTPPVVRSTSPKYYIEMKHLNTAFITLVREVKKVGRSLDPEDLRTICIQLLSGVTSTKRNVQEDIDTLRRCDKDYIGYLQPYWDSLDSDLLHGLICQLNDTKLNEDWETYRTQVKKACTATLEECRRSLPQGRKLPSNQISVGVQTAQPPNDAIVQGILDLKDFLIKIMGLEEADFQGFTNSNVTLFFTVSRSRLAFLIQLFALHRLSLWEFSITFVFVPGEFIYDAITDQEFPHPEVNEDEHLQNEAISLAMKLKEEEMLRKKAEEEQRRIAGELVKMEKIWLESGSKSNTIPTRVISDVESLLGQSSESVEGLQDKIRILVEEWSKISEHEATSLGSEPVLQIKDLKEEMLHQFEQLQTSKVNEDKHLQNEAISLKLKLKAEEELRKKVEEEQERIAGELKKWSKSGSQSNVILKKAISDVEGLLGQSSESVEGLQDKIRILVEEWSKISEHEATSLGSEPVLQIKDLKEEMLHQFEQLQTSKVNEDAMKYEHLQNEAISLELKLKEEKMLREKAEEEQRRIAGELVKMEKKWSESGSKSNVILKKVISDVEGLLGQSSDSVEDLQDKIRILVEEWSKISEHARSLQLSGGGTTEWEDELFALAYKDGVKDKYMCHVYEKSQRFNTTSVVYPNDSTWMYTTAKLHMVITYSTGHWSQIVQTYCKPDGEDWELCTVIRDFIVEGDVLTANIPESSGANWSCAIVGIDQVPMSSLDFTKRFPLEKDGLNLLQQAVKSSFYPPKITLMASSDVHSTFDRNRSRLVCLKLAGSSPGIQIPVQIVERVEPELRQPKKVSKPDSDREAHEEESSSEEDVSSPSMKTGKNIPPAVQKSGMTEASLKTKAATILSASSKEKDQQAN